MQVKKYRLAEQCFLVQGAKAVLETLASNYRVTTLIGTEAFLQTLSTKDHAMEVVEASEDELTRLGSVEVNTAALAVVAMGDQRKAVLEDGKFTLVLDEIRDPGNLGAIIRTADWYGVHTIVASMGTTDMYSPKVINATMGSFLRVRVHYEPLEEWLRPISLPVYGAFLDGKNIHEMNFGDGGLVVIGNESRGISPAVEQFVKHRVTIPRFGGAESLNASVAAAVILDNIRRKS